MDLPSSLESLHDIWWYVQPEPGLAGVNLPSSFESLSIAFFSNIAYLTKVRKDASLPRSLRTLKIDCALKLVISL